MSDDLKELYQQVILDHNKSPRNFHKLEGANRTAQGHNPVCGDQSTVYLLMDGDVIKDISFQGLAAHGSASIATPARANEGRGQKPRQGPRNERRKTNNEELGKLTVFGCTTFPPPNAILAWHAVLAISRSGTRFDRNIRRLTKVFRTRRGRKGCAEKSSTPATQIW